MKQEKRYRIRTFSRMYREAISISVKRAFSYRVNFILSGFIILIGNLLFPLVTILIYGAGGGYPGWSFYEVLLIQGIYTISSGVAAMFFYGLLWETMHHVVDGTFEIVLIKPVNPILYMICFCVEPESVMLVLGGIILVVIALTHLAVPTISMVLAGVVLFLVGILVTFGITLLMAATSFRWVANSRIPEMFESVKDFGKYPLTIFPKAVAAITSFMFPVAMIAFYPAATILGRTSDTAWWAVLPCIIFACLGLFLYQRMIHEYEGVGG